MVKPGAGEARRVGSHCWNLGLTGYKRVDRGYEWVWGGMDKGTAEMMMTLGSGLDEGQHRGSDQTQKPQEKPVWKYLGTGQGERRVGSWTSR